MKKYVKLLLYLVTSFVVLFSCSNNNEAPKEEVSVQCEEDSMNQQVEQIEPVLRDSFLCLDVHDYDVIHDKFPNKKHLGAVLINYGVTPSQVNQIASVSKSVFDVRKIRGGNSIHIVQTRDSMPVPVYFVYEKNAAEYVVYSLKDSITAQLYQKDLVRRERVVSGEIETSLWNSIVGQGVPFDLALQLSNIYAWNIDFFGLQKGDKYVARYVEVLCDSSFVKIDTVKVALFTHCGTDFYAIPFEQEGREDYYDYDGNSLRKAFLKAPLSYSRISSHFTHSRFHPVLKYYRPHHGVDYAAPKGTPVSTIGDGKVIFKGWTGGGGNTVKIQHNGTYTTSYMHLSKFGKISVGKMVKQGEVIGFVGSTGVSTGPHLDFRVYENGSPIDPLKLKSPPVEPIADTNRVRFEEVRDSMVKLLKK